MGSYKILVTGGGGYIGGSVIAQLLAPKTGNAIQPNDIIAVIRKPDVAAKIAKLGVQVSDAPLTDEHAIEELVLSKGVNIVVHCASATDVALAKPLIKALAAQKEKSGREVYFIHTSGTSDVADVTGWTHGLVRDTDPVYELEKKTEASYFLRDTNIAVYELSKELGITLATVVPPFIYGEGTGQGGRQTIATPLFIRAALAQRTMHKDAIHGLWPAVNIIDLADFFVLLIQKILTGTASSAEVSGYFFPVVHDADMWETADIIAKELHARGLVDEPKAVPWESDEAAAEAHGVPVSFIPLLYRSVQKIEPVRPQQLGWKPTSDNESYLRTRKDDVELYFKVEEENKAAGNSQLDGFLNAVKDK